MVVIIAREGTNIAAHPDYVFTRQHVERMRDGVFGDWTIEVVECGGVLEARADVGSATTIATPDGVTHVIDEQPVFTIGSRRGGGICGPGNWCCNSCWRHQDHMYVTPGVMDPRAELLERIKNNG